ncbi:hypothetical protein AAZX31_04G048900 [Glycine max]
MEDGDNILDAIYEEDNLDDDVDMVDVEEGELVEPDAQNVLGQSSAGDINEANQEPLSKNQKRRANKKKNKKKRKGSGSNAMDINRFVLDTCRRLKEKKSYMVYTAVGCLGVSALSDLVNEIFLQDACLLLPTLCLSFDVPGQTTSLFTNCEGGCNTGLRRPENC